MVRSSEIGEGRNYKQYQQQISDLLISLNRDKGIGRRAEYSSFYNAVSSKAAILNEAVKSNDKSRINYAAKDLMNAARGLVNAVSIGKNSTNAPVKNLVEDAQTASRIGNAILNLGHAIHFDFTKNYIIHALQDEELTSATIEELQNNLDL